MGESSKTKNVVVEANKASATARITLPGVRDGADALNCTVSAFATYNNINAATKEDVTFVLGQHCARCFSYQCNQRGKLCLIVLPRTTQT